MQQLEAPEEVMQLARPGIHVSPSNVSPYTRNLRLLEGPGEMSESSAKPSVSPRESDVRDGESSEISREDEEAVLQTYFQLEPDGPVTREAIKARLGWNNRKHWIVKAVCDKYSLA